MQHNGRTIRIGTRKSRLAMWQTETVAAMLHRAGWQTEIVSMETRGDRILDVSLSKIGSKGVFTEELEERLASGDIDIAVHSAKDMPSELPQGFRLIAFSEREQVHDVLLSTDPGFRIRPGARIGTSSVRRVALLRRHHPEVETVEMRGNLQTRRRKLEEGRCDALMLAYAGVRRMGMEDLVRHGFPTDRFVPPVGQGSIAVEAGPDLDPEVLAAARQAVNHGPTETCLRAERGYLRTLQGGCSIPAYALARIQDGRLVLHAGLISLDGSRCVESIQQGRPEDAPALGEAAGRAVLEDGGREILADIRSAQAR